MDDLLLAFDDRKPVLLSLLDCSAAFDHVSHLILVRYFEQCLGISGLALVAHFISDWHAQCVSETGIKSTASPLCCPQGTVLGPILFTIYTLLLEDIICSHNAGFHLYANDSQLYLACNDCQHESIDQVLAILEACIGDIRLCMDTPKSAQTQRQ